MKRSQLLAVFAIALLGALAGMGIYNHVNDQVTVHAQGASGFAPGQLQKLVGVPTPVGNWFGIARPCPATGDDAGHAAFCQQACPTCAGLSPLPPEVPMMPMIHGDGTVTVNDAAAITKFHTTAQGAWAVDDTNAFQITGRTRYQASFIWLDGNINHQFDGVVRPRFVTFFDPSNPDNMIGYIQPYFFPTNGNPDSPSPTMSVLNPPGGLFKGTLNVTNHYPAVDFLAQLPPTCQEPLSAPNTPNPNWNGCLGTYHFTIHRQKANVPNN